MTTTTTIVSETHTEIKSSQTFHLIINSEKLQNRLDSLRDRLKIYKKEKEDVIKKIWNVEENIKIVQESVKNKEIMLDELNFGMNMILKETQKWIDLWKKDEGRLRLEKNTKDANENYIQVDQLSIYIMHLREAILNKRTLIEEREINLERQKKYNKTSLNEIKNEIKLLKQEISNSKSNQNQKI